MGVSEHGDMQKKLFPKGTKSDMLRFQKKVSVILEVLLLYSNKGKILGGGGGEGDTCCNRAKKRIFSTKFIIVTSHFTCLQNFMAFGQFVLYFSL